ncbi:haloalkane dehalogenase [Erythrobacter sanguineus]|uniref:Haloalkane dehalogenase n=1 Tax=Erythrobacter sanguineus TaxID=198312 RepID=A0A1M7SC19_9SPHN|nr:haloalkane dehalogenase [Erythrobacter sanguineus]SHN56018.1 haloalkane dehalogenase [Erythrobacter sanguineus]
MEILRTPDAAFEGLSDFPFAPHYLEIADPRAAAPLRIHYIDEGPRDAPVVLMMHGEPSWSYLYRHMIGPVVAAGYRVLAPDLIGFGKSDKPAAKSDYTYAAHVEWMRQWVEALDLSRITLACQDWGSLVGLRLVAAMPDRFAGVVLSNGGLPEGGPAPRVFAIWRGFSQWSPFFPIGRIINKGTRRELSAAEIAAYDAPFPDARYKAGARIFPSLVPFAGNPAVPDQQRAWEVFERFDKPFLCAFSDRDPITRGGESRFIGRVPGTAGQLHRTLKGGHFIQEDDPQGFVAAILDIAAKGKAP